MTFSAITSKQLAARSGRGDLRALETLLRDLSEHLEDLSPAELAFLDGVTAGVGLDSKALVLGSDGHIILPYDGNIELPRSARFEVFDDFGQEAIQLTSVGDGLWIGFAGTDGDADVAVTVTAPEGQIVMGSGDGGSTEDGSVLSLILLAQGSLVSLGMTVFECRVSFSQITGVTACFGLSDKLATTGEHLLHTIIAGTVADGGLTVTNTVEFVYSEEATAGTLWHAASENAGTIGNSGAEETLTDGPAIDTYDTLRLEVDADGTARFYINGALRLTRATAVATTSLLIPYIAIDGEAATPIVTDLTVDYIYFSGARPSSNA